MAKADKGGKSLLKGMTNKSASGDSGARPSGKSVDSEPTRSSVASGHSIGGRSA